MADVLSSSVILQDNFFLYPKCLLYDVLLTERGITYLKEGEKSVASKSDVLFNDIVGCHCLRGRNSQDVSGYFCLYSYPFRKKILRLKDSLVRHRVPLTFRVEKSKLFEENQAIAEKWRTAVLCLLHGREISPRDTFDSSMLPSSRRMLVFVNPFSGPGKARQIFQERVIAFFAEADIEYKLVITTRANEASDMVKAIDLSEWFAIVIVSGDGLIFEVINGLMNRSDWRSAIKTNIGVIPGGSGNALCSSLGSYAGEPYRENPTLYSSFILTKGKPSSMDLVAVETQTRHLYSFLSIGWGIMADIDIQSEKYRKIGEIRFTLGALGSLVKLKTYKGIVSYIRAKNYISRKNGKINVQSFKHNMGRSDDGTTPTLSNESDFEYERGIINRSSSCPTHIKSNIAEVEDIEIDISRLALQQDIDSKVKIKDKSPFVSPNDDQSESSHHLNSRVSSEVSQLLSLPDLNAPLPADWESIEGEFLVVYATLQSYISTDCCLVPGAKLDDGIIHLVVLRAGIPRSAMLTFFLSLESGEHVNLPYVDIIPVTAFRIFPDAKEGIMTVDGELIEFGPLQAQVLPKMAHVLL